PDPAGTFEATEVDVAPLVAGRVLEVRADLGDRVAKGDTLVVLDTESIALERERRVAMRGTLAAQRTEAEAMLRQAESRRKLAATTLERTQALRAEGSASQQQVDDLSAQVDGAVAEVAARRSRLSVLGAQEHELETELAIFDRQLRDGVVLAPLSGTVLVRAVEPGEVVARGTRVMHLANLEELDLRVFVDAPDLARVKIGQKLAVSPDAMPDGTMQGVVTWISPEAEFTPKNAQTRNARSQLVYAVKLRVANPDGRLHLGMPAEVRVP
ncbi:efflux RND transporter periplasmic adaptor subunit, partial [bacterium]|nr:efflux RND transporter periplasmic adaptor subunit [bacterium]